MSALIIVFAAPWIGMLFIALFARRPNLRESASLITAVALVFAVFKLLQNSDALSHHTFTLVKIASGLTLSFRPEPLGLMFCTLASVLWVINTMYSIAYMRSNQESHQTRFYLCFAAAIGSTMGLALSSNLFTLFIFYEMLTLSTYPLVTHKGNDEARRGGRTYLGYLLVSSIGFLLFAIIWTWNVTGQLEFVLGGIFKANTSPVTLSILLVLFMFGIGKAALMPMHRWLPAAMVAPTPVSALLHAVAVVKAGVFTVLKVVLYVFGAKTIHSLPVTSWLIWLAGLSILLASVFALLQDNLKKRLAYSTVSQLSYVTMAALIAHPITLLAAAIHIVVHAFGKITLFFTAGSIYTATHKTKVSQLNGVGHALPWTMIAFTIGALSMIGLPPTGGFISKWYLLVGSIEAKQWLGNTNMWMVLGVLALSTVLNASYFLPISYSAFFKSAPDTEPKYKEASWLMVLALMVTALGTVILFFSLGPVIQFLNQLFVSPS